MKLLGYTLAIALWLSVFVLGWLMILEIVPMWPQGMIFLLFLFLAGGASTKLPSVDDEEEPDE